MARSVADKLHIKPNTAVWASDESRRSLLDPLPAGTTTVADIGEATTAVVFADDAASLRALLDSQGDRLAEAANLWVAYPKANRADINRDTLWPILAERGLRPIGQVAIDDVWSALRFRPIREGEAPFTGGR